jgi:hypothetical protein
MEGLLQYVDGLFREVPLFLIPAAVSTILFIGSFLLLLLGADHGHPDAATGVDLGDGSALHGSSDLHHLDSSASDPHHLDSAASFKIFTMQSILAFFMGFGWLGLACRVEWNLGYFLSTMIAFLFGVALLFFTAYLMSQVYRLNAVHHRNLYGTLGDEAKVYLTIPAEGKGKVQAVVDGSLRTMDAVSKSGRIEQFKEVEIVGVADQSTLIVREK